jgi:hypothetical protein
MPHFRTDALQQVLGITRTAVSDVVAGGSGALVARLRSLDGTEQDYALKFLSEHGVVVDGHDLESFRNKVLRQHRLAHELPKLYEPIVLEEHGQDYSWFITRWIPGENLLLGRQTSPPHPSATILECLPYVLDSLAEDYARECEPGYAAYSQDEYILRVSRRLDYLFDNIGSIVTRDCVLICGGKILGRPLHLPELAHPQIASKFTL